MNIQKIYIYLYIQFFHFTSAFPFSQPTHNSQILYCPHPAHVTCSLFTCSRITRFQFTSLHFTRSCFIPAHVIYPFALYTRSRFTCSRFTCSCFTSSRFSCPPTLPALTLPAQNPKGGGKTKSQNLRARTKPQNFALESQVKIFGDRKKPNFHTFITFNSACI